MSYRVTFDGELAISPKYQKLMCADPELELEEGAAGTFRFSILPDHPFYERVENGVTRVCFYYEGEDTPVFSGIVASSNADFYGVKSVTCYGDLSFLGASIQRPHHYVGVTVEQLFRAYVQNHNAQQADDSRRFTVGRVEVTDPNNYLTCFTNYETTWQALQEDLIEDYGGYLHLRYENGVRYIDYLKTAVRQNTQVVKLGRNLLELAVEETGDTIYTAVIPLGARQEEQEIEGLDRRLDIKSVNGGVDYISNAELVSKYGFVCAVVIWDDVTVAANLRSKGQQWLDDNQFQGLEITGTALDLSLLDAGMQRIRISDDVQAVSPPHGINRRFRVRKLSLRPNNEAESRITMGDRVSVNLSGTVAGGGKTGTSSGGAASASSIQSGVVLITPSAANTPTYVEVDFPTAFTSAPTVVATPLSTVPGTAVLGCGVSNVTATGCRIYLTRTNTTATSVSWIAVAQSAASGGGGDMPAEITISQSGSVLNISNVPAVGTITQSGSTLSLS